MSRTAVIVALLVTLVLGGVALWLTSNGPKPAAAGGPLLAFDPARVSEIRMDYPDGSFQTVRKDPAFEWRVVLGTPGKPERSWPAAVTQAHSALRLLARLEEDRPGDGAVSKPAGTLRINSDGAPPVSMTFGEQRLGGKVLVEVVGATKRTAWIDAQMADMFVTTGPQAWRSAVALPGVGSEVSRISMQAQGGNSIALARVQGKWSLQQPVGAPAEADEVTKLIGMLGRVQIIDFCDKGAPTETGLEKPAAKLWIETDERDATGALTTIRQTLTVGQAADMNGQTMVARLERTAIRKGAPELGGGETYSTVVVISGDGLAAINTNPASYVSKRAIPALAADIGQVRDGVRGGAVPGCLVTHRRTLDGWETQCGDEGWRSATAADAQRIEALIELLTATPAELVTIENWTPSLQSTQFELLTLGGVHLADVSLVSKDTKITVFCDGMKREYPAGVAKVVSEALPVP